MKKNLTEIVFILDRSGSMAGLEADTIGGFNAMIAKQRQEPGEALISTILFDDRSEVLHDRTPVSRVRPMTARDYTVRGSTALLDAIGGAIHHIGNVHKYARDEDRPEHTLFVITTDGMENASHWYDSETVKRMIRRQQKQYGWEFLFLGANIDAVETARHFGIGKDRAVNYRSVTPSAPSAPVPPCRQTGRRRSRRITSGADNSCRRRRLLGLIQRRRCNPWRDC